MSDPGFRGDRSKAPPGHRTAEVDHEPSRHLREPVIRGNIRPRSVGELDRHSTRRSTHDSSVEGDANEPHPFGYLSRGKDAMTRGAGTRPYRPQMPEDEWAAIEQYVQDLVARAEPLVSYDARELYPVVARLAQFAHRVHMPLEDDEVLAPFTVERFVQFHLSTYNRASRNSMRARIRRVSEALLGDDTAVRTRALGKAEASRPYSRKAVAELDGWALAQPSEERHTSARALLALGLGAGLTGAEIIALRTTDVSTVGGTTLLTIRGAGERSVPVLRDWSDELNQRVTFVGGDGWMFRSEQRGGNINLITDFVSRNGPHLPLQARRMRATWLVHHLETGTPVKTLLRIAGLKSAEALDRVLPFVDELS